MRQEDPGKWVHIEKKMTYDKYPRFDNRGSYGLTFPFRFSLFKDGITYKPFATYDKRIKIFKRESYDSPKMFNFDDEKCLPIGYALFKYVDGKLLGFSKDYGWSTNRVYLWNIPPRKYFKPSDGHFIIKTTRTYKDFKILSDSIRCEFSFIQVYNNDG